MCFKLQNVWIGQQSYHLVSSECKKVRNLCMKLCLFMFIRSIQKFASSCFHGCHRIHLWPKRWINMFLIFWCYICYTSTTNSLFKIKMWRNSINYVSRNYYFKVLGLVYFYEACIPVSKKMLFGTVEIRWKLTKI